MIKKLEVAANLALIITSVVVCTVLIKRFVLPSFPAAVVAKPNAGSSQPSSQIAVGTKVSLPGIRWNQNVSTVVLALSTKCHFCTDSAPFYQTLMREHDPSIRVVAVLPQPQAESQTYLSKLGIAVESVTAELSSIGVTGTPTLLLVDNQGQVKQSWVGKIAESEQSNVLTRIKDSISR
jgi:hypothetical protein